MSKGITMLTVIVIAVIVVIAAIVGVYLIVGPPSPREPQSLYISFPHFTTMDPVIPLGTIDSMFLVGTCYNRLVKLSDDQVNSLEIVPDLAESWDIASDGMTYTFYLREGVKFHDGTAFNASAVEFWFERHIKTIKLGHMFMFEKIHDVEVVDDYTVRIVMDEPYGPQLLALATHSYGFVSPTYVAEHQKDANELAQEWLTDHECGTGPYMVTEYVPDDYIKFERFPGYFESWEEPYIDEIFCKIGLETTTARLMLERGELDITEQIDVEHISALETAGVIVEAHPSATFYKLPMNMQREPTNNSKVRQAFAYAFDYDAAIAAAKGYAVQARGPVPPDMVGADPTLFQYKRDVDKAKQLLVEAGYPGGEGIGELRITVPLVPGFPFDLLKQIAEILQSNLAEIGVDLKVELLPAAEWVADRITSAEQAPDIFSVFHTQYLPDPLYMLRHYHTGNHGTLAMSNWYEDPEYDALVDQIETTVDEEDRIALLKQAQEKLVGDCPDIWVMDLEAVRARQKWVKGFVFNFGYVHDFNFHSMWIDVEEKAESTSAMLVTDLKPLKVRDANVRNWKK